MPEHRFSLMFLVLLCLLSLSACSDDETPATDGDADLSDTDIQEQNETEPDAESEEDAATPIPREPEALPSDQVLHDQAFLQEINHTWNEAQDPHQALVALAMPPETYTVFDKPTLVSPRGVFARNGQNERELHRIPDDAPDLIDAETISNALVVASASALYSVRFDGAIGLLAAMPDGVSLLRLVVAGDTLFLLTSNGWGRMKTDLQEAPQFRDLGHPVTALSVHDGNILVAWPGFMAAYASADATEASWRVEHDAGVPAALLTGRSLPQNLDLVLVGSEKLLGYSMTQAAPQKVEVPLFAADRVPLAGAKTAILDSNGGFWVAATGGVYRIIKEMDDPEFRVYVPDRWMPNGDVKDVLEDQSVENGPAYFATTEGLGSMTRVQWSLTDKVAAMKERIELRHDRDGAVADSRLTTPGDLSTNIPWDSDNDGGWSCYWVLSECFRYKLTGDPKAKQNFDKSLDRMLSYRTLTGTDYFLARAVIRIEGCRLDDCDAPDDGEWFLSPDKQWWVKANTSNDEVTSHMFMMGYAYDFCADETQKTAIAAHVDGIVGGIIDHGYQLIDPQDGKCTKYGQFDPFYVNDWFDGRVADGGHRSAQMLGAINLAYHVTGKQKYLDAKKELIEQHHYDTNISNVGDENIYPLCGGSGDCDELSLQAFYPLIRYEWDDTLHATWLTGWKKLYNHLKLQEDPFWDIANTVFTGEAFPLDTARRWMQRYPTDLIRWVVYNDVRKDTTSAPAYYLIRENNPNFRLRSDGHIFPPDERPNDRHNTSQFMLSGGLGAGYEMDGADAMYPYWLGRYYGFIVAP